MSHNKKNKNRHFGRRQFLIGSGAMMALPPLISLMPRHVAAQVLNKKVRVMTFIAPFGIDYYQLFPEDPVASLIATSYPNVFYKRFSEMPRRVSRILDFNDSNLSGLENKMNLYRGLSLTGGSYSDHNHSILSGTYTGKRSPIYGQSIDVIIENALRVGAIRLKTVSHNHDKANEHSFGRNSAGQRQVSSLIFGDGTLFNMLFPGGSSPTSGGGNQNDPSKKQLIVDKVLSDLQSIQSHRRLSQNDRNNLSDYVDAVNDLQKRIIQSSNPGSASCTVPNMNFEANAGAPDSTVRSFNRLYDNYADLITLAAQCDNARVFHIANTAFSDTGTHGNSEFHHSAPGGSNGAADRHGWGLRRMARIARRMDQVSDPFDPGKTLLDNSVLFWTNELASWTTAHSLTSLPAITFGSGGGYFKTGEYIDYRHRPFLSAKNNSAHRHVGHPYKQLLISIMRAAGLQRSQYINIGDGNGFGEFVPTLNGADGAARNAFTSYQSTHNDPLPYVSLGG
jgi:hypothetical protein